MRTVRILIKKELQNLRLKNSETYANGYKILLHIRGEIHLKSGI